VKLEALPGWCWSTSKDEGAYTIRGGRLVRLTTHFTSEEALHSCGVRTSGRVACWGSNYYGQSAVPSGFG
jgi:Regulator of chromosome condensation (RCC1) repeat